MKTEGWLLVALHYARCEHICRLYVTAPQGLMLSTLGHCARLWGHRSCTKVLLAKVHFLVCEAVGLCDCTVHSSQNWRAECLRMSHGKLITEILE